MFVRASRVVVAGLVALTFAASARAADSPGASALKQARAAWDSGAIKSAEPLYRDALEKGGLAPNEVLEGYVRLGSIRAVRGKKDQAIAAFRAASILDASFAVPREAGAKGAAYADKARKDTAKIGSIQLALSAPKEAPAGKTIKVTATLDRSHVGIVNKVGLYAKDTTSGKEVSTTTAPDESMELEIPSDVTLPGANILVRVDALDGHQNRLASTEEKVKVPEDAPAAGAVAAGGAAGAGASGAGKSAGFGPTKPVPPPRADDQKSKAGGGFWKSPWPYVIGGVALVGASTAVYFGTRPPADVTVGQVGIRER